MAVNYIRSGVGVNLHIQTPDDLLDSTMQKFGISESAVRRAETRAINKTVRWLKAQMARQVSQDIGVAQKHIKRRMFAKWASKNNTLAKFWMGVGGINPMSLGLKGRVTRAGYKVGKFSFDGGFRAYYLNKKKGVAYAGGVYRRVSKERMPIKSMDIDVSKTAKEALDRLFKRAETELYKKLRQELNYEMHRAMGTV